MLRAGGYGLALAVLQTVVMDGGLWYAWLARMGQAGGGDVALAWIGSAASSAVLIGAIFLLLRREHMELDSRPARVALVSAVVLALASTRAPGVGPAAAILVVGYANGNRVVARVGIAALVGYLFHFYYALHATLLVKSAWMAATGAALLLARLALHRWAAAGRAKRGETPCVRPSRFSRASACSAPRTGPSCSVSG